MTAKQRRGEATVDRVLTAALDLYSAHGFKGLTMSALIEATGVSSGSLYHHFESLDGLCAALYSRCMADLLDALISPLERARSARGGIRAMVGAYLRFVRDNRAAADLILSSPYAGFLPAYAARIAADKNVRLTRITDWLRPHVEAGRVVSLPDPLIEMLVIGPLAETARRWLAGVPIDLDAAARLLPDRIWQSIQADGLT